MTFDSGTTHQTPAKATRRYGLLVVVAGAIAWVASGILVLERLALYKDAGHHTSCDINPWVSCGAVMKTWQAALLGFPNPLLGIVGFAIVVAVGMAILSGARFARWYWIGFQTGITAAFALVVWLWTQAVYEINILCLYCMVVWAMTIPLFVHTTARNVAAGVIPASAGVRRFVGEWAGVTTVLLILGCAASIFFRFMGAFIG